MATARPKPNGAVTKQSNEGKVSFLALTSSRRARPSKPPGCGSRTGRSVAAQDPLELVVQVGPRGIDPQRLFERDRGTGRALTSLLGQHFEHLRSSRDPWLIVHVSAGLPPVLHEPLEPVVVPVVQRLVPQPRPLPKRALEAHGSPDPALLSQGVEDPDRLVVSGVVQGRRSLEQTPQVCRAG
jgi:hypothetical protein